MADLEETPVILTHHGKEHTFTLPSSASISDLSISIQESLSIPIANQKLMVAKLGLLKPPFSDTENSIATLHKKKITLLGTSTAEIASLTTASESAAKRAAHLATARRNLPKAYSSVSSARKQEDSQYTFQTIRPLPNLPHPEKSASFLKRLADDAGIRAAMRAHKFSVGLLTEMDPLSYTESSHEGTTRILGLNRNKGEVIELRLRTDAYDGYRDYKTIRNTLCHELAHNVHGPHDRKFWDLCHQIEREVAKADWRSGGRSVGDEEFAPARGGEEEEIAYDHGGWTGGEYVLGGGGGGSSSNSGAGTLSRREIMAKAAEERMKRAQGQSGSGGEEASGSKDAP
ncbi:WLM domain-containing protein [Xylariaceae sp. FL0255]|nr:WLM domain-containing protein [Xylariaceae sp. FL0255]